MREEESTAKDKEEAHSRRRRRRRRSQQWVYVRIENCTFNLEFCSLFGWLEFGGKEKKEPVWDSSFGLLAIDEEEA